MLDDEKLKEEYDMEDGGAPGRDEIREAIQDALEWPDKNKFAYKEEFEAKQEELEGLVYAWEWL